MKRSIILTSIILIICFILSTVITITKNIVTLTLNEPKYEIMVLSTYEEKGVTCKEGSILKGYKECDYTTNGNVNTNKIGTYKITYKYKNKSVTRTISVVDRIKPEIILNEESLKVCPNQKDNINLQFSATDNYDGDITNNVTTNINNDLVTLTVKDSSQNETIINKNLIREDKTKPTISLKGNNPYYLLVGETYKDPGYTISDNCDTNIKNKINITNNINTQKEGTYEVKYTAKDESGNFSTVKRTIRVITKQANITITPTDKTIYLTFDDGPGRYTEELLTILKKYNVKATFFVTNQFPKYKNCIKKAYDDGHGIALHTYTHKWSIYSSTNNYFNDLNKISDLVKSQTGQEVKLLRFPGGSGNTVSYKYKKGIMSTLTKEVEILGYKYFDWNIDSGDTSTTNSKTVANNVIKKLKNNNKVNIVLLHDIKKHSVSAISEIIEYGLANGFKFAKLTETSPTIHSKVRN